MLRKSEHSELTGWLDEQSSETGEKVGTPTTIMTFTGRLIDLADPQENDICIEDIAHSLSLQCRWTGHTSEFYSVAQHSVVGSYCVPVFTPDDLELIYRDFWRKVTLMHDAGEAYYGDLATPFKVAMGDAYDKITKPIDEVIYSKFDLVHTPIGYAEIVKPIDRCMLSLEAAWLVGLELHNPRPDVTMKSLDKLMSRCWSPNEAEDRFLGRWEDLHHE